MIEFLISALNVKTLTMLLAAVAATATVLTLAMPLVFVNPLDKRMRAVALEREKIRQRERERMAQENQKVKLRQTPKQYVQTIVDQFNLSKWVGQEEARLKLIQAGYRGQAPYVTYLFVRMVTPVVCFLFALVYLFVVLNFDQPATIKLGICRSSCLRTRSIAGSYPLSALSPTRSTCC
jgi:tight adherence protein C